MVTGREDLLGALIEAFLMEKGTKVFYSEAAEKAVTPEAKKIFKELSDWEEQHMSFIQFLYQAVNDDHELKGFEEFKNKMDAPLTEAGIPVKVLEERLEKYAISDEMGALALAMEIEGKAYSLYRGLSGQVDDNNARVVFKEMMEQELKHINYLKQLRVKLPDVFK